MTAGASSVRVSVPHTEVFRSPNKRFVCRTKIVEQGDSISIQRTLLWYDTVQQKYRKRREIQTYHCCDEEPETNQQGYEFETLMLNRLY